MRVAKAQSKLVSGNGSSVPNTVKLKRLGKACCHTFNHVGNKSASKTPKSSAALRLIHRLNNKSFIFLYNFNSSVIAVAESSIGPLHFNVLTVNAYVYFFWYLYWSFTDSRHEIGRAH